jgi:hypothetical protein
VRLSESRKSAVLYFFQLSREKYYVSKLPDKKRELGKMSGAELSTPATESYRTLYSFGGGGAALDC